MAFGFERPARGLIVAAPARPTRVQRFLVDFAHAYADELAMLDPLDERSCRGFELLFSLDPRDATRADRLGLSFVPCFPDPALHADASPARLYPGATVPAKNSSDALTVCLFGPESTGKSTLASALAHHYRTLHVTEYVRGYLDAIGSPGTLADVPWIARGQRAAEIATSRQVRDLLVSDTNLATIMLWSDVLFGGSPPWLREAAFEQKFDLWLLTDIDVPFESDPQRCFPDAADRAWLMRQCRDLLDRLEVAPVLVRGSHDERLRIAIDAIERLRPEGLPRG